MLHEKLAVTEGLAERIRSYLPSPEVLKDYPSPRVLEKKTREEQEKEIPGADYVLTTSRYDGRLVIVPYHHPENSLPPQSPGSHYSHVAFEGLSLTPRVSEDGRLIGGNLVLFSERMARMRNSIRALGGGYPGEEFMLQFEQGIVDLSSVLASKVLVDGQGNPTRAYSRPSFVRMGTYGVAPKTDTRFHLSTIEWNWPLYITKEAYEEGAIATVFLNAQRLGQIRGKLAGNYVDGGVHTKSSRELGGNEVLYLGPYVINEYGKKEYVNYQAGENATEKLLESGILVDGSGEDVIFEGWDGTVYYQPMDTNVLGGTTRAYVLSHICRSLGIQAKERAVGLRDIRNREIVGATYLGNAVKALGVREIQIFDTWKDESSLVESLSLNRSPSLTKIQERFEEELFGFLPPSDPSLLTPVSLEEGLRAREVLDRAFLGWF